MLIPILKGTTERIESVKDGEIIVNGCPDCHHDLVLKQFRKWSTIFTIPYLPGTDTRFVYECTQCLETYDVAYRKTYINRAKYRNASPKEVKELTDSFSLAIFASLMAADDRPIEVKVEGVQDFAIARKLDLYNNTDKLEHSYLLRKDLPNEVFELFDLFRDSFIDDYRIKALQQVLIFGRSFSFREKEMKLLYTYCRHWGIPKEQFGQLFPK